MTSPASAAAGQSHLPEPGDAGAVTRLAVLSDMHISPAGTPDGRWNNATLRSRSAEILRSALAEIVRAGHSRVLVLGDLSDDGSPAMIGAALSLIEDAGLTAWVVPGNHDTGDSADAIDVAAGGVRQCAVLYRAPLRPGPGLTLVGAGLETADGGQTCTAVHLPEAAGCADGLLLWAGHYPLLSQRARLRVAGLRYPGDLLNLRQARAATERFPGPIAVLHGHLHTTVTRHAGRILQLGFPAVVEWPHAWTDLTIETSAGGALVQTATRPVAGQWSRCERNTQLAATEQSWQFSHGQWHAVATTESGAGQ